MNYRLIGLGFAFGAAIGASTGHLGIGITLGTFLGVAASAAMALRDRNQK